jgi:hypothetical protein
MFNLVLARNHFHKCYWIAWLAAFTLTIKVLLPGMKKGYLILCPNQNVCYMKK